MKTAMPHAREQRILAKLFWPGFWLIGRAALYRPRKRR